MGREFCLLYFKVGGCPRNVGEVGAGSPSVLLWSEFQTAFDLGFSYTRRALKCQARKRREGWKRPMLGPHISPASWGAHCLRVGMHLKKAGGSDLICPGQAPVFNQHAKGTRDLETLNKWPTAK